jgi:hypothetical protein
VPAFRLHRVGNGDLEPLTLQTNLDGDAYHRVVIDHKNARHDGSFCSGRDRTIRMTHRVD